MVNELTGPDTIMTVNPITTGYQGPVDEEIDTADYEGGASNAMKKEGY